MHPLPTLGIPFDRASGLHLELQLAHVHRGASARRLGRIHRAECLPADLHVLSRLKVLLHHGRPLILVNKDPEASRGNPLGRTSRRGCAREGRRAATGSPALAWPEAQAR